MIAPAALYIHVPLCRSKCAYCDFFSLPVPAGGDETYDRLVAATLDRAGVLTERFEAGPYRSVFVGGGTPTALPDAAFARLLRGLAALAPDPEEWTVEANPESLSPAKLEAMLAAGVTRLSLGVQSLDDGLLRILGRPHDAELALKAMELASSSGLELSADLMACLPQPPETRGRPRELAAEAERLAELGADHLSIYDLVLEEGTPLAASLASGRLSPRPEELDCEEREAAEASLAARGFRRYEISNYALPGSECLHNLAYWRMDSYLGAGPGAVSTIRTEGGCSLRIEEWREPGRYGREAAELAREERVPRLESAFEALMMAFRTRFGLDLDGFARRFGCELAELLPETLASWEGRLGPGWGGGRSLALDEVGLDLQNRFLADCLGELERTGFPGRSRADIAP
ncbi:MAG TPA: radical SAM family heme chaperone HemW [Spirochaetia bacterium]|nr:radical SAM family heme chaperone HemW [Spirochaetia bacterium]